MMHLEGTWPVYQADEAVGSCEFVPQGLYWKIHCTVGTARAGISRLVLFSSGEPLSLGIPIPQGGILTLEKRLPRKNLPQEGDFLLELLPADAPLISARKAPEPDTPEETAAETAPSRSEEMPPPVEVTSPTPEDRPSEPEETPEESPCDMPEEVPDEVPRDILPGEESGEQAPASPEQKLCCSTAATVIPFRPGDPLPSLKDWQHLRAVPDGQGGFLLHREE